MDTEDTDFRLIVKARICSDSRG